MNQSKNQDDVTFTGIMIPMDEADNDLIVYGSDVEDNYYEFLDELYEEHVMLEQYERLEYNHEI